MQQQVAITGLGVISPIGLDVQSVAMSLRDARSGISTIRVSPLEREVAAGVIEASFEAAFTRLELPFLDRCQQMAILAARQAVNDAGFDLFDAFGQRAGLYYGNVNGGVASAQAWYQQMLLEGKQASRPYSAMAIMGNAGAAQVALRHKVLGPVISNATACGSSGVAISDAARAIRDGYLDVAIAGGAEAPLVASLVGVFQGTRAMSPPDATDPAQTCKPFARDRSGLVLGEGAAFLVLESAAHAHARGARCYGYVSGSGISNDAHHIGMPASEGQVRALRAALSDASLDARDVGYVNAHATATEGGDVIEAAALREVFGAGPEGARVSSTKSVHGHLLGATSALELLLTIVAMEGDLLPASAHLQHVDPRCELNHVGARPITGHAIEHALSFSCGFGGTNVALVVSRRPPDPST
ncbi:beta-ketoacyl-[acyl-carrier-protein] synthase family protein [Thermomonas carbonis]|uniref:Nodulation protein E n=1 Tax=Thermomonas carbonis TaxID=1463158 RepID=A0A7G9SNZ7_9GAMM|nr:beta-ketoacyl-[acyl-carrier-protein] synthase family protein [Thermomonas carbonis]QNN69572.1 beta-ketoacyl-[acyl-carrier-protein] synthase family protein [Thermomonas carbonis]GHB93977.1 3-oxoacyl-[acyl-carrier-protein] synthase 2 [Thermomonas carbonis]